MATAPTDPRPISILECPNCDARNRIAPSPRGAPHCGTCGKPLPWLVKADETTFDVEVRAAPTVVVDLWAPWCGPCRFVGPILEGLARQWAGRIKVVKVNVDENQGLALKYDARSIPTMLVMRDGEVVDRIVGALPEAALSARLAPQLKPPRKAPARDRGAATGPNQGRSG
jgi:thioredoxin 2